MEDEKETKDGGENKKQGQKGKNRKKLEWTNWTEKQGNNTRQLIEDNALAPPSPARSLKGCNLPTANRPKI